MIAADSPAKINLSLRVLCKREDGYHEIRGLFQTVDLCDHLSLFSCSEDRITCTDPNVPLDTRNLVAQALHCFRKASGFQECFHIHIEKRIPMGAGLGGGSSNAATTLWLLNQYYGNLFSITVLQQLGAKIGADVPFFFSHGCALCEGFGERVTDHSGYHADVVIVKPPFSIATKDAYAICTPREGNDVPLFSNDLEKSAMHLQPELQQWKLFLMRSGFTHVWMTGSGSALICFGSGRVNLNCEKYFVKFLRRKKDFWYDPLAWKQKSMTISSLSSRDLLV